MARKPTLPGFQDVSVEQEPVKGYRPIVPGLAGFTYNLGYEEAPVINDLQGPVLPNTTGPLFDERPDLRYRYPSTEELFAVD